MLVVCCVLSYADDNDHGGGPGDAARALTQWQCLVASRKATVVLHQEIMIALYRPGSMVINIAVKLVTLVYIRDNSAARKKNISPSFLQFS
jgi:hypothetical protein